MAELLADPALTAASCGGMGRADFRHATPTREKNMTTNARTINGRQCGELHSEATIWADGTRFTADELCINYEDYCTAEIEAGHDPDSFESWVEDEMNFPE